MSIFETEGQKMHEYRFYGVYRAFVFDNRDPEKQNRIKVTCPAVYGYDESGNAVESNWAYPMAILGGGVDYGCCIVPPVNDKFGNPTIVWIMFEMGDKDYPVWIGSPFGKTSMISDVPEVCRLNENGSERMEPNNFAFVTPGGSSIELDDNPEHRKIKLTLPSGDLIELKDVNGKTHARIKSASMIIECPNTKVYGSLDVTGNISAANKHC